MSMSKTRERMKLMCRDIYPLCISSHTATAVLLKALLQITRVEIHLPGELRTDHSIQLQADPGLNLSFLYIMILPGHFFFIKHLEKNQCIETIYYALKSATKPSNRPQQSSIAVPSFFLQTRSIVVQVTHQLDTCGQLIYLIKVNGFIGTVLYEDHVQEFIGVNGNS